MTYLNNDEFFDELEVANITRRYGEGDQTLSYQAQRRLYLRRTHELHLELNKAVNDHFFNKFFTGSYPQRLRSDIQEYQRNLARIRARYYDPQNRLTRALKGLS